MPLNPCSCDNPAADPCEPLPAGFVRLRYFFGKRLGVADFVEEQRYHTAKHRFHNRRLHGAGILCGLRLTLASAEPKSLRVERGAALDRMGREIIVGTDQCIDVGAWFQAQLAARRAAHAGDTWPTPVLASGWLRLAVRVRFVECATHPEPAPRDTCACSTDGGCDYGRVREGFEMDLVPADEVGPLGPTDAFPALQTVANVATAAPNGDALRTGLAAAVAGSTDDVSSDDGWLLVGELRARIDSDAVAALELLPPAAPYLLSSAVQQELLVRTCAASAEAGWMVPDAPVILGVELTVNAAGLVTFTMPLSGPIEATTFVGSRLIVRRLVPGTGWRRAATGKVTVGYDPVRPALFLRLTNDETPRFFETGGLYRLALTADGETPVVDAHLRPLLPLRFSWSFQVAADGASFKLVSPFAP